jgi:molybdopterin synthase sulfur carrier subunit
MALVRLRGPLKKLADDRGEHELDGDTVAELIATLERTHPTLDGWILDERGHVRRHINVFVNGELAERDAAVSSDDKIDILPAISGG